MVMLRLPSQGGLPFLSNPTSTTGAGPTTLQQGPPLLPPGTIQGDPQIRTWPSLLLLPCLPVLLQDAHVRAACCLGYPAPKQVTSYFHHLQNWTACLCQSFGR